MRANMSKKPSVTGDAEGDMTFCIIIIMVPGHGGCAGSWDDCILIIILKCHGMSQASEIFVLTT